MKKPLDKTRVGRQTETADPKTSPAAVVSAHTPTPWAVSNWPDYRRRDGRGYGVGNKLPGLIVPADHIDRTPGCNFVDDEADKRTYAQSICSMPIGYRHRSDEEIWANAALIVRAVNHHAQLVEALRKTLTCRLNSDVRGLVLDALRSATGASEVLGASSGSSKEGAE